MTFMISLKTLKDIYTIDDNVEDKYLLSTIQKGQDFIVAKVLGLTKYNELLRAIESNNLTDDDNVLLGYIEPILAYYVMSETVFSVAYKMKNNPDYLANPNPSRFDELVNISNKYLKDSQHYEQILRDYICDNNIILSTEDSPVLKSGYKTGIYLG